MSLRAGPERDGFEKPKTSKSGRCPSALPGKLWEMARACGGGRPTNGAGPMLSSSRSDLGVALLTLRGLAVLQPMVEDEDHVVNQE